MVLYEGMAGVNYRGPKNQRAAINFHALAGVGHGDFTETPLPPGENVGLYSNRTKPMGVAGASIDFNRSKNLAIRAFTGFGDRALWIGDAGVFCGLGWGDVSVWTQVVGSQSDSRFLRCAAA